MARYKHRGFKEEREVRAVFSVISSADKEEYRLAEPEAYAVIADRDIKNVQFRKGLVPYIALMEGHGSALPIEKIIVGPHKDKLQRKDHLDAYLRNANLKIETRVSETPFA